MKLLEAALDYAGRGWHVFPLIPGGKDPFKGSHGYKDATTDPQQIMAWWKRSPRANIGVACGASGIVVLDGDIKHGADPDASLKKLLNGHHTLPPTLSAQTPSGGWHMFYAALPGVEIRNSAGQLGEGLDVRSEGGVRSVCAQRGRWQAIPLDLRYRARPLAGIPARRDYENLG